MSDEGQVVVEENGYVSNGSTGAFSGGQVSGKVTVAGSSSVTPVMEKLAEAYKAINPLNNIISFGCKKQRLFVNLRRQQSKFSDQEGLQGGVTDSHSLSSTDLYLYKVLCGV